GARASDPHTLSLHDALPISLEAEALRSEFPEVDRVPVAGDARVAAAGVFGKLHVQQRYEMTGVAFPAPSRRPYPLRGIGLEEGRSEEHTSELQSRDNLVCRL